ncbi:sensor histidine kinase [Plebeiibacterium sediminum]|uniref:histidine kinase n=1 Tax=Plebeiibacterium sediminum TaxID=2992112 RepID=A0AAE3M2S3_9BACT|nr:sensor histidine kinase [Plebeiobacterium sediminum]MCW3785735.1 sensor histidine kinase [Plebeiobacterium sediminum]
MQSFSQLVLKYFKSKYLQNILYALFVVFALAIMYKYGFYDERSSGKGAPKSVRGELILKEHDFDHSELFQLQGEFSFYWNKLYSKEDINALEEKPVFVTLPSVWNDKTIYSDDITAEGFATYYLTIKVPDDGFYGIRVKELDCAYKLMVNGEIIEVGKVGTSTETTVPSWKRQEIYFYSHNKKIDVVLQISNFHHRKGGPEDVMLFGKASDVRAYILRQLSLSIFLLAVFCALAGYFLHIYIVGRRDVSIILFSLLSMFGVLRLATTGEKLLLWVFPSMSWEFALRIEYLAFIVITGLFFSFLRTFYSKIFTKKMEFAVWLVIAISVVPVLFMSPFVFTYIPLYYQFFAFIVSSYMLYGVFMALLKKLAFSGVFFVGIFFFYASFINDILYFNKMIDSGFLLPYGLFFIFFSFSFVMAKKLTHSFLEVDLLSTALKKHTMQLEQEVNVRTQEIRLQKDSIEKQAFDLEKVNKKLIELNRFRDGMTGMIVHDLKNPLNSIINLSQMHDMPDRDKLIWQAGIEMHNMVLNILDVNKAEEVGFSINRQFLNLNDAITSAIHDVSVNVMLKGICIERIEPAQFNTFGDFDIIKRILVNILINAIRFSPTNGKIFITLEKDGEHMVICKIKDQGPGITKEMQSKIFDRYKSGDQADQSLRSTGLGLAFCKLAIEAHGGSIAVHSNFGDGAEFQILIPVESCSFINKERIKNEDEDQSVKHSKLSLQSKNLIVPYLSELKEKEVFEVTDINKILGMIGALNIEEGHCLIERINEAVFSCNQERYIETINRILS